MQEGSHDDDGIEDEINEDKSVGVLGYWTSWSLDVTLLTLGYSEFHVLFLDWIQTYSCWMKTSFVRSYSSFVMT